MLFYLVITGGTVKTQLYSKGLMIGLGLGKVNDISEKMLFYLVMTGGTVKIQLKPYSKGLMIGLGLVSRLGE